VSPLPVRPQLASLGQAPAAWQNPTRRIPQSCPLRFTIDIDIYLV